MWPLSDRVMFMRQWKSVLSLGRTERSLKWHTCALKTFKTTGSKKLEFPGAGRRKRLSLVPARGGVCLLEYLAGAAEVQTTMTDGTTLGPGPMVVHTSYPVFQLYSSVRITKMDFGVAFSWDLSSSSPCACT